MQQPISKSCTMAVIGVFQHMVYTGCFFGAHNALKTHCQKTGTKKLKRWDPSRQQETGWHHETKSCPICWEKFASSSRGSDQRPLCRLQCGHVFDQTCLDSWLSSGCGDCTKCPLCQQVVVTCATPFRMLVACRVLFLAAVACWMTWMMRGCLELMEATAVAPTKDLTWPQLGLALVMNLCGVYLCVFVGVFLSLLFERWLRREGAMLLDSFVVALAMSACGGAFVGCFHRTQQFLVVPGTDWQSVCEFIVLDNVVYFVLTRSLTYFLGDDWRSFHKYQMLRIVLDFMLTCIIYKCLGIDLESFLQCVVFANVFGWIRDEWLGIIK